MLALTTILLHLFALFSSPNPASSSIITTADLLPSYDYIIIGSGPGGGPLSARLALAGYTVLLIEAGSDPGSKPRYQVPALHAQSSEEESMRWDFYVQHYADEERQKKDSKMTWRTPSGDLHVGPSSALGTREPPEGSEPLGVLYPRAGALGGCSAHNALITVYPHESDWNGIASLTGDSSWEASNMRSYFEKLERSRYLPNGVAGHGFTGWLTVMVTDLTLVLQDLKLLSLVVAGAKAMGKSALGLITTVTGLGEVLLRDINANTPGRDDAEGLYQVPLTMDDYHRVGSREFVLDTAEAKNQDGSRKYHLDVLMETLATKVKLDTSVDPPRATGVDFLSGKSLYRADPRSSASEESGTPGSVNASREVIISAGAFNTPQLLKLSGIGPADELATHDIPLIVDSPGVGTNMQDRYETSLGGEAPSNFALIEDCTFLYDSPDPCYEQWRDNEVFKGVYGSNGLSIGIVKKSSVAEGNPDLFIAGAPAYFIGYFPGYSNFSLADKKHWVWVVLKAHSRNNAGTVKLTSSNPRDVPEIVFNSFDTGVTDTNADEKDLQAVVEGMEFSRKIFDSLNPLAEDFEEVWPGSDVQGQGMEEFVRNEAWGHHACCTARIGADDDEMAVLDSRFRVRGTKGLRIADASVFPEIPGFYIAIPVYMIAEKAAEIMLEDAE